MLCQPRASGPLRSRAVVSMGLVSCVRGKVDPRGACAASSLCAARGAHGKCGRTADGVVLDHLAPAGVKQNANRGIIRVFRRTLQKGTREFLTGRKPRRSAEALRTGAGRTIFEGFSYGGSGSGYSLRALLPSLVPACCAASQTKARITSQVTSHTVALFMP